MVSMFNWVDFVIIGIFFLSFIVSVVRGFAKEVMSILVWIIAFGLAAMLSPKISSYFAEIIVNPMTRNSVCFVGLFVIILIFGMMFKSIILAMMSANGKSTGNRLFGGVFGIAKGGVIVTTVVFVISLTKMTHSLWYQQSQLIPYFEETAQFAIDHVPGEVGRFFSGAKTQPQQQSNQGQQFRMI